MNPFYNPIFLSKILKSYLFDIDRLKRFDEEKLRRFQDEKLRKVIRHASTVQLYRDLYKKAGINFNDIKGIKDIKKLPFVTKDDIKKYYPDGIISSKISKDKLVKISTSGTSGKSVSIFSDMFDVVFWLFIYIRILREYGISWRKNKLSVIADFAPYTIGSGYVNQGIFVNLKSDLFFKNIQWLNTNDKPMKLIKEINNFKPDFIGGYPGMLGHLALLKENGYGRNIQPSNIATIGSVLDKSLKKYIESIFGAVVFEVYGATESGTIAYECKNGKLHVMSDLVYLEFLKNNSYVESKKPGNLVVTKLYGGGTPIIRYNAINDIVSPLYEKCNCGIRGVLIDRIYGRDDLSFVLTDGKVMLASSFSEIFSKVLYELKSNKLIDTKIIQHDLNKVEILIQFDEDLKDSPPSNDEIFDLLKNEFIKKIGDNVEIEIKEVTKIEDKGPRIVSKVDRTKLNINKYI